MRIFIIIKEVIKSISAGLSLTVLERGNHVERAYFPSVENSKK